MSQNPLDKFRATFTLKQHTPIIHFQSEQKGATLRATELKPKLDRFLIEQFEKEGVDYISFLVSGKEKALDYKVTISPDLTNATEISDRNPLFFGNMGDGKDKRFKENNQTVKVTFFSYHTNLIKILRENFEAFLAKTNFATRQSKGFGSFYLSKPFDKTLINHQVYSFTSSEKGWQTDIKDFYSFLRAGINTAKFRGIYAKAVIFSYAMQNGITWDKKAIKKHYMNNQLKRQQAEYFGADTPVHYESNNTKIVRDLFGLSSSQSWMSYKATVTKDDTSKEMTRFKSPIIFKPVKEGARMRIYFWANKSVEHILNKEFLIQVNNSGDLKLQTPSEFSFDDFFDFAFNLDLSKHISSEYHNNDQYKKLVRIFNEIKESK
ncbi:hypothetical protein [Sulfurovum sp.]|uniref:hypothetical protein n=1 Tax=Sulfurovum sp. TaxID=1969726 RepID=UPI0025E80C16|nr:hypothetical protein [Sulfurovum sp.]